MLMLQSDFWCFFISLVGFSAFLIPFNLLILLHIVTLKLHERHRAVDFSMVASMVGRDQLYWRTLKSIEWTTCPKLVGASMPWWEDRLPLHLNHYNSVIRRLSLKVFSFYVFDEILKFYWRFNCVILSLCLSFSF